MHKYIYIFKRSREIHHLLIFLLIFSNPSYIKWIIWMHTYIYISFVIEIVFLLIDIKRNKNGLFELMNLKEFIDEK